MSTLATIQSTDLISGSRTDINNNFTALNTDKIETSVLDTDTSLTANSDSKIATQKAVKTYVDAVGAVSPATTTSKGSVEIATDAEVIAGTNTGSTGASLVATPGQIKTNYMRFGGTGADGALSISSGTTTIDLGGLQYIVKNYTSISITGTGKLAFTNKHANGTIVILKSQGDVTLTSSEAPMIDCSALGGNGGVGGNTTFGAAGTNGIGFSLFNTSAGTGGVAGVGSTGGAVPTTISLSNFKFSTLFASTKYNRLFVGAGGGGGSGAGGGTPIGGNGGAGGGGLVIECAGAWNFTTTNGISVAGGNGSNGGSGGSSNSHTAGGAGGGGGFAIVLYNSLTANSGTINVSGGTKGTDVITGASSAASTGGGGGSATNAGTNGVSADPGSSTGGTGGAGLSLVELNTN